MLIHYQILKEDSKKFQKAIHSKKEYVLKLTILAIIAVWFNYISFDVKESTVLELVAKIILSFAIIFLIFYVVPYSVTRKRFNQFIESLNAQPISIIIIEEGLEISNNGVSIVKPWGLILNAEDYNGFVYIQWYNKTSTLIPERAFKSSIERTGFLELLINKSKINHSQSRQESIDKYKLLGLLCLLPNLGLLVGLIILFKGIDLKSKLLKLIGIAGVLITLICNYILFNKKLDPRQMSNLKYPQTQLTTLVKEIEYYKLINGKYPDSLNQLSTDDNFVQIVDMTQFENSEQEQNFNYQNLDTVYILFSSGKDGKPFTSDDQFPEIKATDSNNLRYLRGHIKNSIQ